MRITIATKCIKCGQSAGYTIGRETTLADIRFDNPLRLSDVVKCCHCGVDFVVDVELEARVTTRKVISPDSGGAS